MTTKVLAQYETADWRTHKNLVPKTSAIVGTYFFVIFFNDYTLFLSIGANIKLLIERPDGLYCFREQRDRVYYVSEKVLKFAESLPADSVISVGTCFGKFTKSQKFRLHITALNYIAPYAQVVFIITLGKPWVTTFFFRIRFGLSHQQSNNSFMDIMWPKPDWDG